MSEQGVLGDWTALLETLRDGVLVTEADLKPPGPRIVYVNPAFQRITGYSAEQVIGATPRLLQGPQSAHGALADMRRSVAATGYGRAETVNYAADGTPFRMQISISPLYLGPGGALSHYLAVERDITDGAQKADHLRQLEALTRIQREAAIASLNIDRVRQRTVETVLAVVGADAAVVEEVEGVELVYRAVAGTAADQLGLRLPMDQSASGLAFRKRETVNIDDVDGDERIQLKEKAHAIGFRSGIMVPLTFDRRTFGVLKIYADRSAHFGPEVAHLLELASGVLASALHNAREHRSAEQRRALLLDALPALISYVDKDLRYQEVNAAYEELYGRPAASFRGKSLTEVMDPANYERLRHYMEAALRGEAVSYEEEVVFPGGDLRIIQGNYTPHRDTDGQVQGFYAIVRDVTEHHQAYTDHLTGLKNRREYERQGCQLLGTAQRYGHPLSMIMADLDHFKALNDSLGHLAGDAVLQGVADLLQEGSREADLVARWGGEEFILMLPETDLTAAAEVAERLRAATVGRDYGVGQPISASWGVTEAATGDELHALQARADRALYEAKNRGRNRVVIDGEYPET